MKNPGLHLGLLLSPLILLVAIVDMPASATTFDLHDDPAGIAESGSDGYIERLIRGLVTDPAHAPIAGAQIVATSGDNKITRSATSNQNGEFSVDLAPGSYTVKISALGFGILTQAVLVGTSKAERREFSLSIATADYSVDVTTERGYEVSAVTSATKTPTLLRDLPQSISIVTSDLIRDQSMQSMSDVMRYVPGVSVAQGEGHRDQVVIRGNSTTADFFVDGMRDDVMYIRDLYNVDRVEVLKGSNAMAFGRGGGGGVINRVLKDAEWAHVRMLSFESGSYLHRRATTDLNQPFNSRVAGRVQGMYESSGSFRDHVTLERYGINPTATIKAGASTPIRLSYEYFRDRRVVDRGVPSYAGRPLEGFTSIFFGNPYVSHGNAQVHAVNANAQHQFDGNLLILNQFHFAHYEKTYQNSFAGAVSADGQTVALSAYNHSLPRDNYLNQTVATYSKRTGPIRHLLMAGVEEGHQVSPQLRNTGYYNNQSTSITVPLSAPTVVTPITWRQAATDADSRSKTNTVSVYGQDQIELSRHFLAVVGIRYDRFNLRFHNNRDGSDLGRVDNLASPRAGLIYKASDTVSLYGSYGVSYLPSSGDQFLTLTVTSQNLKPEKFTNYECGLKWDMNRSLSLATALYRLDRTNTTAIDPNNPAITVLTGSSRTNGYEASITGRVMHGWEMIGAYGYQNAYYTSATTSAARGAHTAIVPRHTFSLWNNYRFLPMWGVGLGVVSQSSVFAAVDNTVRLPGFGRLDASTYVVLSERLRLQLNAENLLDKSYYPTANSNNNISVGSPRAFRATFTGRF
jgi:catecholate siderophore receptor